MKTAVLVCILVLCAMSAQATPFYFHDGFNTPTNYFSVHAGTMIGDLGYGIGPWTVGGYGVDWQTSSWWTPEEGNGSLDLNALNAGSVYTTLSGLTIGDTYNLTFWLAGNTHGAPTMKTVNVAVGDLNQNYSFDVTGHSNTSMGWTEISTSFMALSTDEVLTFTSLSLNSAFGPAIDDVTVWGQNEGRVPEPASFVLAGAGLLGLALLRRRRA